MVINDAATPNLPPPPSEGAIGIREFAGWCKAADLDEWTAMIQITDGNHAAAFLLRFMLRWGEAEPVKAAGGWFYREAEDFANEAALTRTKFEGARKCLRTRIGLLEDRRNKQLPSGDYLMARVNYYCIDRVTLRAAFEVYCLELAERSACKTHADLQEIIKHQAAIFDAAKKAKKAAKAKISNAVAPKTDTTVMQETYTPVTQEVDSPDCQEIGSSEGTKPTIYKDSKEESLNHSLKGSSNLSQERSAERDDPHPTQVDLPMYLHDFYNLLGTPNGKTASILEHCNRLGAETAGRVVQRCMDNNAGSWQYILNALANERPGLDIREVNSVAGRYAEFFER